MAKGEIATVEYVYADGSTGSKIKDGATAIVWKFAHGATETVRLEDFSEEVLRCATLQGLRKKIGDVYASIKSPVEAHEEFVGQVEQLTLSGGWYAERKKGEPRVGDLIAALVKFAAESGKTGPDFSEEAFRSKVQDEAYRTKWRLNPRVAEIMLDIQTDRRRAAIAAAAEKIKAEGGATFEL